MGPWRSTFGCDGRMVVWFFARFKASSYLLKCKNMWVKMWKILPWNRKDLRLSLWLGENMFPISFCMQSKYVLETAGQREMGGISEIERGAVRERKWQGKERGSLCKRLKPPLSVALVVTDGDRRCRAQHIWLVPVQVRQADRLCNAPGPQHWHNGS